MKGSKGRSGEKRGGGARKSGVGIEHLNFQHHASPPLGQSKPLTCPSHALPCRVLNRPAHACPAPSYPQPCCCLLQERQDMLHQLQAENASMCWPSPCLPCPARSPSSCHARIALPMPALPRPTLDRLIACRSDRTRCSSCRQRTRQCASPQAACSEPLTPPFPALPSTVVICRSGRTRCSSCRQRMRRCASGWPLCRLPTPRPPRPPQPPPVSEPRRRRSLRWRCCRSRRLPSGTPAAAGTSAAATASLTERTVCRGSARRGRRRAR